VLTESQVLEVESRGACSGKAGGAWWPGSIAKRLPTVVLSEEVGVEHDLHVPLP